MNRFRIKFKSPIFIIASLITAVMIFCMFPTAVLADGGDVSEITSVTLNKKKTELTLEISLAKDYVKENKSANVHIFEILPYQSENDINSLAPVKSAKVGEKMTVKLPFVNGNMNRLYSKFVVAEKVADGSFRAVTNARYIDNTSMLAENTEAFPEKSSKKGLLVENFSDAQQLGVAHTIIDVPINEYMLWENSDDALSFIYNAQTFYVRKSKMALLDHRVKTYTDAGINVYFNIILTEPYDLPHALFGELYGDLTSPEASQYAINANSETGMKLFQAFVDYLAAHYTRADRAYGFVPAMILGFEVNSTWTWNNLALTDIESQVDAYIAALRVLYTAMTSHYSEGRVYISLGNNFCAGVSGPDGDIHPDYGYPAKDYLDLFATKIKECGDIPWGLAVNPYPSDRALIEYWSDSSARDAFETSFITMKNIGTLTRYMHDQSLLYMSEPRSVIISEFAIPGNPESDGEMTMQAAAYALAYYTAAQNEDIDAFIYGTHADSIDEGNFCGLWTEQNPAAKKPIYNVFSLIDTAESENATAFVKQTAGNGAYNLFMPENVDYKSFDKRTVVPAVSAHSTDFDRGYKDKKILDLTAGSLQSFYPSDGTEYVELRPFGDGTKTMLYAKVGAVPTEYKGISNTSFAPGAFENAHYITLRIMADTPAGADTVSVMLRLQNDGDGVNNAVIYEGEVTLKANAWTDVSFKIKDFSNEIGGNVDLMKLWVRTADSNPPEGEYGLWLENVTIHTKGGMSVIGWIFTILLIFILLIVVAYAALVVRAQMIRKKRRAAAAARRREALRQQQMSQTRTMYPPQYTGQIPRNNNNQMR